MAATTYFGGMWERFRRSYACLGIDSGEERVLKNPERSRLAVSHPRKLEGRRALEAITVMSDELAQYFVYTYRGLQYALPVLHILEIVQVTERSLFHGDLPGCFGNIVHRNMVLPVFDPTVLGTDLAGTPTPPETVIIVKHNEVVFGLAIDHYVTVLPLATESADHTLAVSRGKPFVEAVHAYRKNTLITFSVPAISQAIQRLFGNQTMLADDGEDAQARSLVTVETVQHSVLCARLERVTLGSPVEQVIEVIEDYDVTPLFQVTPGLRGLINLRGQVLACLDISQAFGLPLRRLGEHNQFIVLQGDGTELALCVDTVLDICRLPQTSIQKADTVLSGESLQYVQGIIETAGGTIMLLSVPSLFDSPYLQPYQRQEG
jgi:purine-binding chemotaxis protein CheW